MQYLACMFPRSTRQYTYHFDSDEEVKPGRKAEVYAKGGPQVVTVARIVPEAPSFKTAPITRLLPETPDG